MSLIVRTKDQIMYAERNPKGEYYYGEDVKKAIKRCEEKILNLSILEKNKNLNVSEVVEKTLDIIKEELLNLGDKRK